MTRRFFERVATCSLAEEVTIELPAGTTLTSFRWIEPWLLSAKATLGQSQESAPAPSGKRPRERVCCSRKRRPSVGYLFSGTMLLEGKSLAQEFVRLNSRLIVDIEVWRYIEGSFERVDRRSPTPHGNSGGAT